jgi:hypothetical protein
MRNFSMSDFRQQDWLMNVPFYTIGIDGRIPDQVTGKDVP